MINLSTNSEFIYSEVKHVKLAKISNTFNIIGRKLLMN